MKKDIVKFNLSGGKSIEAEHKVVSIDELKLDLDNPRFRHKGHLITEDIMEKEIWDEKDTKELYNSIIESKGISEPLYLRADNTVIEGNRRLVCLRHIKKAYNEGILNIPKELFTKIDVYVFPSDTPSVDLDVLLARLHVTGKKEWTALNQAEHIRRLYNVHGKTFDQISNLITMSKGKVFQKYWTYEQTTDFLLEYPKESITRFSFFEEAYKKRRIREWMKSDKNKKEFYRWVVENKFDMTGAKDIRNFIKIMNDPELMRIFEEKGFSEAYFKLTKKVPAEGSATFKSLDDALVALRDMPLSEFEDIAKNPAKEKILKDFQKEIQKILDRLGL